MDSKTEAILSDISLPRFRRLWWATGAELKTLFQIAAPACIVYLLNYVMSTSTQVFCGHLGNLEFAASSLGNNGLSVLAFGLMVSWKFFSMTALTISDNHKNLQYVSRLQI